MPKYTVTLTRDTTESQHVTVNVDDEAAAMEKAMGEAQDANWRLDEGNDQNASHAPYVTACEPLTLKQAFLICPVRGADEEQKAALNYAVKELEAKGWEVHFPPRDTDQNDSALHICTENLEAIEKADRVFVVWDGKSQGCLFDAGIAFALHKPVTVISCPGPTREKSFNNLLWAWSTTARV